MLAGFDVSDVIVLIVDIVAVIIIVVFLKRKIQHKLHEVETRQAYQRLMKKQTQALNMDSSEE